MFSINLNPVFGVNHPGIRIAVYAMALISLLFAGRGISRSFTDTRSGGAVDFRNRVVACRQAKAGFNPYEYRWRPGDPESLLDNHDSPRNKYTRMTSSPFHLLLFWPWCNVNYGVLKWINYALQWIAYFIIWILLWSLATSWLNRLWCMVALGSYANSELWMYHVERGQQYVFFVLLGVMVISKFRFRGRAFTGAVSIALRPTLFPFAMGPFVGQPGRPGLRTVVLHSAALSLLFLLLFSLTKPEWWVSYANSARDWYNGTGGMRATISAPVEFYPMFIEEDPTLGTYASFSAPLNPYYTLSRRLWHGPPPFTFSVLFSFCFMMLGSVYWLWINSKNLESSNVQNTIVLFSLVYLGDIILPAPRGEYNNVLILPVIGLCLANIPAPRVVFLCSIACLGFAYFPKADAVRILFRNAFTWIYILLPAGLLVYLFTVQFMKFLLPAGKRLRGT